MISLKGPGLKIFAAILAVIALAFGAYSAFFRSEGFVDGTATIISVEEDPDYIPDPDNTGGAPRFTNVGEQVRIKYPPEKPRYAIIIK